MIDWVKLHKEYVFSDRDEIEKFKIKTLRSYGMTPDEVSEVYAEEFAEKVEMNGENWYRLEDGRIVDENEMICESIEAGDWDYMIEKWETEIDWVHVIERMGKIVAKNFRAAQRKSARKI